MATSLSRAVGFRALHRFFRPDWSEARNREAFGPLSEAPGHAHDYRCVVTVGGPIEASRGMVMDLGELDRILRDEVVTPFDGKHLNLDVPEFAYGRTLPTCEAIAAVRLPPRGRPSSRRRGARARPHPGGSRRSMAIVPGAPELTRRCVRRRPRRRLHLPDDRHRATGATVVSRRGLDR